MFFYKSFGDFGKFLRYLKTTRQSHVASLLSTSHAWECGEEPLNDTTRLRLKTNRAVLGNLIDTKHSLLDELLSCDCISSRQREYIKSTQLQAEIGGRLLDILSRGSEKDFNKFIECLKETNQGHLVIPLAKDGVLAYVTPRPTAVHLKKLSS
jgi:Caspase recruitment domain